MTINWINKWKSWSQISKIHIEISDKKTLVAGKSQWTLDSKVRIFHISGPIDAYFGSQWRTSKRLISFSTIYSNSLAFSTYSSFWASVTSKKAHVRRSISWQETQTRDWSQLFVTESIESTYSSVGKVIKFLHLMQILEVLHPLMGYTSGNVLMPVIQLSGRSFLIFLLIDAEPTIQSNASVFYLFLTYTTVELIRYAVNVLNALRWLFSWLPTATRITCFTCSTSTLSSWLGSDTPLGLHSTRWALPPKVWSKQTLLTWVWHINHRSGSVPKHNHIGRERQIFCSIAQRFKLLFPYADCHSPLPVVRLFPRSAIDAKYLII